MVLKANDFWLRKSNYGEVVEFCWWYGPYGKYERLEKSKVKKIV